WSGLKEAARSVRTAPCGRLLLDCDGAAPRPAAKPAPRTSAAISHAIVHCPAARVPLVSRGGDAPLKFAGVSLSRRAAGAGAPHVERDLIGRCGNIAAPVATPGAGEMALVETRGLVKRFGALTAVDGITFAV